MLTEHIIGEWLRLYPKNRHVKDQLIHYLEGMMKGGVQFVHGGQLFGWDDTNIPELINSIKQKKEAAKQAQYEAGDILRDHTGQTFAVIWSDDKHVHLTPNKNVLVYPKDTVELQYEKMIVEKSSR
jgi:hypothetical protein